MSIFFKFLKIKYAKLKLLLKIFKISKKNLSGKKLLETWQKLKKIISHIFWMKLSILRHFYTIFVEIQQFFSRFIRYFLSDFQNTYEKFEAILLLI